MLSKSNTIQFSVSYKISFPRALCYIEIISNGSVLYNHNIYNMINFAFC